MFSKCVSFSLSHLPHSIVSIVSNELLYRQIESLPVVVVLMKRIGARLLGMQLDSRFNDIEFPTHHFIVDLSKQESVFRQFSPLDAILIIES